MNRCILSVCNPAIGVMLRVQYKRKMLQIGEASYRTGLWILFVDWLAQCQKKRPEGRIVGVLNLRLLLFFDRVLNSKALMLPSCECCVWAAGRDQHQIKNGGSKAANESPLEVG